MVRANLALSHGDHDDDISDNCKHTVLFAASADGVEVLLQAAGSSIPNIPRHRLMCHMEMILVMVPAVIWDFNVG